ncbi:MAG: homoserine lactone transporter [Gammaproteobacteria bacterium CG11_big_fil_rev_8_21_14_0_20_46_22]|nr:MAG: homoserine lactone transporter [Gammaproteobacteria bacterium CG12_big_fil_rev_8_21_14_0_65_46_12]PIR10110.1 MAG: homoserine lactone transporter [Gammaproteobacteria bacterium CG11_big_fil_rev_8_21_14_0_20_46_22]
MNAHTIFLFILASLMLNILPGQDMLFIISRTLAYHLRGGLYSVAGISVGLLVYTLVVASGLSAIMIQSHILFNTIKFMGAIYLVYLGIKLFKQKDNMVINSKNLASISAGKLFLDGFVTNVLNPKILVFFIAFLPQFVQPENGGLFCQFALLGLIFIVSGTCVNSAVVLFSHKLKSVLLKNQKIKQIQARVAGMILIALGLKVAFE